MTDLEILKEILKNQKEILIRLDQAGITRPASNRRQKELFKDLQVAVNSGNTKKQKQIETELQNLAQSHKH